MDESLQQLIALALVVAVVGIAVYRRAKRNRSGAGHSSGRSTNRNGSGDEKVIKFVKRR